MLEPGCTRAGITETSTFSCCLANYSALIKITSKTILQIVSEEFLAGLNLRFILQRLKHAAFLKAWTLKNVDIRVFFFRFFLPIHRGRKKSKQKLN